MFAAEAAKLHAGNVGLTFVTGLVILSNLIDHSFCRVWLSDFSEAGVKVRERQRRDPEGSRRRLLLAGAKVFAERGPDGTSVAMVAREARLNRRMLYHYFGSKEGLYRAVIEYAYEHLCSVDVELAHMLLPVEKLLAKMIRAYYEYFAANMWVVRLLVWENLREGKTARALDITTLKAPIVEALRIALARGRAEGRFRRNIDERQLLISCMGLSFFYFSNRHTVGQALGVELTSPKAIERRIRHVVALLLDGIRAGTGK